MPKSRKPKRLSQVDCVDDAMQGLVVPPESDAPVTDEVRRCPDRSQGYWEALAAVTTSLVSALTDPNIVKIKRETLSNELNACIGIFKARSPDAEASVASGRGNAQGHPADESGEPNQK